MAFEVPVPDKSCLEFGQAEVVLLGTGERPTRLRRSVTQTTPPHRPRSATPRQGVGTGTSLADKVAAAQSYLASGDTADACAVLTGFIHEAQAQSGKQMDPALASQLIADAQQIQAVLAC